MCRKSLHVWDSSVCSKRVLLQVAHVTGVFVKYNVQGVGAQQIATPFPHAPLLIEENNINNDNNDNISHIMSYY